MMMIMFHEKGKSSVHFPIIRRRYLARRSINLTVITESIDRQRFQKGSGAEGVYWLLEITGMSEPKFENRSFEKLNFDHLATGETFSLKIGPKFQNFCLKFMFCTPYIDPTPFC